MVPGADAGRLLTAAGLAFHPAITPTRRHYELHFTREGCEVGSATCLRLHSFKGQNSGEDPGLPDPEALEPHASLIFIPAMRHYHWGITSHLPFLCGNKLYNIVIENCLHFKYF